MRSSKALISIAGAIVLSLATWALFIEPRRLVVQNVAIALPHWPREHHGLRVALLSDLHVGSPYWGLERTRDLVATTNAQHPDLILLAGDYVIDGVKFGTKIEPEIIAEVLGDLHAPLGVVAVLGNHDWWNDGERITRALSSHHIVVLENRIHSVTHQGRALFIVGLADAMTRESRIRETLAPLPKDEAVLVLSHEPDVFVSVDERASLTLAGHTHGGQVVIPWIGRPVVPSDYGERFAAGHVVENGRHLFVTTGVGTSIFPIRFGVPPELVMLTLQTEENPPDANLNR